MGIGTVLLVPVILFALWMWIGKPITKEARRQLHAEISDLEETIRLCDEALAGSEITEEAKSYIEGMRESCRRSLAYLQSKLDHRFAGETPDR